MEKNRIGQLRHRGCEIATSFFMLTNEVGTTAANPHPCSDPDAIAAHFSHAYHCLFMVKKIF